MRTEKYNRLNAVNYAKKWALSRNPDFYDFDLLGGDCTNFISQCIYAGSGQMNFTPVTGWFYRSLDSRAPAWTGVEYLYNFLIDNKGAGPFCKIILPQEAEIGDIIQLGNSDGDFYHSLIITETIIQSELPPDFLVCAHSFDVKNKRLSEYNFAQARFIHISGISK